MNTLILTLFYITAILFALMFCATVSKKYADRAVPKLFVTFIIFAYLTIGAQLWEVWHPLT